jgi:hypothetical protein
VTSRRERKEERRAAAEQGPEALRAVLLRQAAEAGRTVTAAGIDGVVKDLLLRQERDRLMRTLKPKRLV